MDNNFNFDIQNEITENERYEFCYTPEDYKQIYNLYTKRAKISTVLMTVLLFLLAIALLIQYHGMYGIFTLIFAIAYALLQAYRFAEGRRKQKEHISKSNNDVDIYEISDNRIIYSNYINGELVNKCVIPYSDISFITENDEFIQFQYENKIYSLKKSEIRPDSVVHVQFGNVKAKMKKQSKFTSIGAVISIIAVFVFAIAVNAIEVAESYFMNPSYWVYFLFLIAPVISLIYALILKKKKYPYASNMVFGILMSIVLIVCGCQQFFYMDYFGDSANVVAAAEEKLGIEIPESEYVYFYKDNYSDDENIKIIYDTEIDYYEDVELKTEDTVWLDELPDEFIDVIPNPDYYVTDEYFILYNVDNGEINQIPTENGPNRMVFLSYCVDEEYGDYMTIIEYVITI